ncbi:MAG: hypothetical protein GY757_19915 [bacterium]|nr:hypothetical protein [bacterium]
MTVKEETSPQDESERFDKKMVEEMVSFNAVYFMGGDQSRYQLCLIDEEGNDSPLLAEIRRIYTNGGVIGGNSAGAAIMSDPMITFGNPGEAMVHGAEYKKTALAPIGKETLLATIEQAHNLPKPAI